MYSVLLISTPSTSRGKSSPSRRTIATKSSTGLSSREGSGSSALEQTSKLRMDRVVTSDGVGLTWDLSEEPMCFSNAEHDLYAFHIAR
jgi:hypothetical protein